MPTPDRSKTTCLLRDYGDGDESAADRLMPLLWDELRNIAAACLSQERLDHTLQPTALVNEVYLRLVDATVVGPGDRERFLGLAARTMRRVLVDHARRLKAGRRGGGVWQRVTLHPDLAAGKVDTVDVVELNELLDEFSTIDPRAGRVVELRFFGGLSIDETAAVLGVSDRTVDNDWYAARAWLTRAMGASDSP